jgi:hypothetical protein
VNGAVADAHPAYAAATTSATAGTRLAAAAGRERGPRLERPEEPAPSAAGPQGTSARSAGVRRGELTET